MSWAAQSAAAIKLSDDADVLEGLHIAPSVEVGLRAMCGGLAPVWALVANALTEFPTLPGVETPVIEED